MNVLFVTSGGGHFSPLLAVLEKLPKDLKRIVVLRKHAMEGDRALSLEYQTVKTLGIPFKTITAGRLQRITTIHTIPSLLKIPLGFFQAFVILSRFQPDVVVSFGGYVAIPVIFSALLFRIPIVIHEQTQSTGLSNQLASFIATKICVSWEDSIKHFPNAKVVFTGNPLREGLIDAKYSEKSKLHVFVKDAQNPIIYITGGSTGSHGINKAVGEVLEQLLANYVVIHQTGDAKYNDFELLTNKVASLDKKYRDRYFTARFIDPIDVGYVLKQSQMVVARAGIQTVTELLYFQKKCILIPLPNSQQDEQRKNAELLENAGLGIIIEQKKLTQQLFLEAIELITKRSVGEMKTYLFPKDAAVRIIKVIQEAKDSKS